MDYSSVPSTLLTYLPSEFEKQVNFTILDNDVLESLESFNVSLTSTGEVDVGTMFPSSTTVYITDNDGECVWLWRCGLLHMFSYDGTVEITARLLFVYPCILCRIITNNNKKKRAWTYYRH